MKIHISNEIIGKEHFKGVHIILKKIEQRWYKGRWRTVKGEGGGVLKGGAGWVTGQMLLCLNTM